MFAQVFVALQLFHDHIQRIGTDAEIRLCERDNIFTIVRIDPRAILEAHKPEFLHELPQQIAYSAASFRYVEKYDSPAAVPTSWLVRTFLPQRFKLQHPFAGFRCACVPLAAPFFKRDQTLDSEPPQSRIRLVSESCVIFPVTKMLEDFVDIRHSPDSDHNTSDRRDKKRFLERA